MTDAGQVKYRPIPSSEDQANHFEAHESDPGLVDGGDNLHSATSDWLPAETQLTIWTYFLLGCAILLPWNASINATSFFLSRLVGSSFYSTFSSYLSSVYTLSNLVFQFYSTFTSKQSSSSRRIVASIIGMVLLLTSLCLSTFVRGAPSAFFAFSLFNAIGQGIASGYLCTAVYAGASLLGGSFLQVVISGQAAVAVAVSIVQVVSSTISLWGLSPASMKVARADIVDDQAEELSARIFFGASAVFLAVTFVAYVWLERRPFYKTVVSALEPAHRLPVGDADERVALVAGDRAKPQTTSKAHVYRVCKQNSTFMFSIAYVFAITLAVFPAITVRVRSVNMGIHPMLFAAFHFLAFNTGDLVGRYSCSLPRLVVWSARKILVMSLLRTLFVPLLLLCNIQRPVTIPPVSPVISSDILFMTIMLAMGWTNGYVSSLALLAVSSLEHNPRLKGRREDVDIAATLGGSFVIVGLALGAFSSFGIQAMV